MQPLLFQTIPTHNQQAPQPASSIASQKKPASKLLLVALILSLGIQPSQPVRPVSQTSQISQSVPPDSSWQLRTIHITYVITDQTAFNVSPLLLYRGHHREREEVRRSNYAREILTNARGERWQCQGSPNEGKRITQWCSSGGNLEKPPPPLPLTEWTSFTLGQMMLRVLYNDLDAWVECSNRSVAGASFLQVGIQEHVPLRRPYRAVLMEGRPLLFQYVSCRVMSERWPAIERMRAWMSQ